MFARLVKVPTKGGLRTSLAMQKRALLSDGTRVCGAAGKQDTEDGRTTSARRQRLPGDGVIKRAVERWLTEKIPVRYRLWSTFSNRRVSILHDR